MTQRSRSLFRRLVAGIMLVMCGVWTCLIAAVAWEALGKGVDAQRAAAALVARQSLAVLAALPARGAALRRVAAVLEQGENARRVNSDGALALPLYLQVWQGRVALFGSARLPSAYPSAPGLALTGADGQRWVTAVRADPAAGLTVRVAIAHPHAVLLVPSNLGFYLLPLLISFPFLLVPVWLAIRIGLRPIDALARAIEARPGADLTPLPASSYREIAPLVGAVNRLMARLSERLLREQEFLADAAHELKTPLAVIQVNAEMLEQASSPDLARQAHHGLRAGVTRAAHAVHQLLALARSAPDRDHAALCELDLAELVRERLALHVPVGWQRGVEIVLEAGAACRCRVHPESLALLLDNLIDNAIKYSPSGGVITVRVGRRGAAYIEINDQGCGIPPACRARVFERFYRIPGQDHHGSGLGLAIAERAALRNHGSIRLDTGEGGRGLLVTVVFADGRGEPPGG